MISRIINVLVGVITLGIQPWLVTLTSPLVIADITKISSNNCLQIEKVIVARNYLLVAQPYKNYEPGKFRDHGMFS